MNECIACQLVIPVLSLASRFYIEITCSLPL